MQVKAFVIKTLLGLPNLNRKEKNEMNSGLSSKNKGIRHRTNGPQSCRPREAWVFAPFGAITQSSAAMRNFAARDHGE